MEQGYRELARLSPLPATDYRLPTTQLINRYYHNRNIVSTALVFGSLDEGDRGLIAGGLEVGSDRAIGEFISEAVAA